MGNHIHCCQTLSGLQKPCVFSDILAHVVAIRCKVGAIVPSYLKTCTVINAYPVVLVLNQVLFAFVLVYCQVLCFVVVCS